MAIVTLDKTEVKIAHKLALQADLCYNMSMKYGRQSSADNTLWHITSTLLRRLATMDTIPQDAQPRKQCSGPCGRTLPATPEYFNKDKSRNDGLRYLCKMCQSEQAKSYRKEHPEVQRAYYTGHRKEKLQYAAEYRVSHREMRRQSSLKYYASHQEEIRKWRARDYIEHQEERRERNARYYAAHYEIQRQYSAQYRQEHQEQVRQYRDEHRDEHRRYDAMYYQERREEKSLSNARYRKAHYDEVREKQKQYWQTERGRITSRSHAHNRRARKRHAIGTHTAEELYQQLHRQKDRCYYCHAKLGKGRNNWHEDHVIPLSRGGRNSIDNIVIACPKCNLGKYNKMLHEWAEGSRLL